MAAAQPRRRAADSRVDPLGLPSGASTLGIVDLGSNTSRLVVFAYEPGLWFRQVDEIREPVRLGEGLAGTGALTRKAVERTLAALRLYEDYARASRLDRVEVLATSAVRDAANGPAFLREVATLGLDARVLTGDEEAALGVLAVANSCDLADAWVVDLGGGSAQVSRMAERQFVGGEAYPLGAVRLTEQFLKTDPPRPAEVAALEARVEEQLARVTASIRRDPHPLVGIGGSLRNLARVIQKQQLHPLDVLHGFVLRRADLEALVARLLKLTARRRARVRGIKPDRADVILAAALVFRALLRASGRDQIQISGQGLRDGAFYRAFLPAPHLLADPRHFSVDNLFRHYPQPREHTARVRRLARQVFDGFAPRHGLGPPEAALLDAAAILHDIGMAVEYHEHHRHGAYLLETWSLPGFSHREQALLSLLVRYHRKGTPRPGLLRPMLGPGDNKLLRRLVACLRLAECLERSHAGRVESLDVDLLGRRARIRLAAHEDPAVELWAAEREIPLLAEAFDCQVELTVVDG